MEWFRLEIRDNVSLFIVPKNELMNYFKNLFKSI